MPGRDAIVILPRKEPELLAADGHHWLPKQQIVKVVRLMGDSKAMEVALAKRMTALTVAFATDEVELQRFKDALNERGLLTTVRASRGQDIFAACGLLSTREQATRSQ